MKRTLILLLLCFLTLAWVSCAQPDAQVPQGQTQAGQSQPEDVLTTEKQDGAEQPITPEPGYAFVSYEQKQLWRQDLIARLANIDVRDIANSVPGAFGVGLMDLDCDGTPEVIAAYPGGSMGNVFLEVYDLKTGEERAAFNAGHYEDSYSICMHVADCGGEYVIITQGVLRNHDIGWLDLVGVIDAQLGLDYPFGHTNGESAVYYYQGKLVENREYIAQYKQFFRDHKLLSSTGIQLIQWESLEGENKAELDQSMADALLGSSQNFIDFSNQP